MNELRACRENNELEVHAHIVASGPPGYSPTVDVEETETGVEVTVNDLEGEHKTEIFIPKKVSDLENDEHFIKDEELAEWAKQPEKPEYTPEEVGADPEGSAQEVMDALDEHKEDKENPHAVTAEQVGADPEGSADAVQQDLDTHKNNRQNPHGVTPEQIGALPISTKIPTKLSDLTSDTTHRLVTDVEKNAWNGKYRKPDTGIPISDLDPSVADSLNKADSAVQTETDPTVPSWAKQPEKPSYTYDEVGADRAGSAESVQQNLTAHANNKNNPHNVTIQQIGAMSAATKIPATLADLSSDTAHRTVTDAEKNAWNSKYKIPTGGIPKSELSNAVQTSLSRADVALVAADLADYYNKSEVDVLVSAIPKFAIEVVDSLPTSDISNTTVYLLKENESTGNLYTEYIYVNNAWEVLGSQRIDLTGYATEEWVTGKIAEIDMPTLLSQLESDSQHRTVTDDQIAALESAEQTENKIGILTNKTQSSFNDSQYPTAKSVIQMRDELDENLIVVSNTEPTSPLTREWVDEEVQSINVPTEEDFNNIQSQIDAGADEEHGEAMAIAMTAMTPLLADLVTTVINLPQEEAGQALFEELQRKTDILAEILKKTEV